MIVRAEGLLGGKAVGQVLDAELAEDDPSAVRRPLRGPVKMVRLAGYGASPRTLVKAAILTPH